MKFLCHQTNKGIFSHDTQLRQVPWRHCTKENRIFQSGIYSKKTVKRPFCCTVSILQVYFTHLWPFGPWNMILQKSFFFKLFDFLYCIYIINVQQVDKNRFKIDQNSIDEQKMTKITLKKRKSRRSQREAEKQKIIRRIRKTKRRVN